MATEVTPLPRLKVAKAATALTPEQKYWTTFSSQTLLPTPTSTPITHISSNSPSILPPSSSLPQSTPYIAITTGPRLQLLSTTTLKPVRTITRTTSAFHGASVRRDGRIVLAGSDSGAIQAFDTSSRAILKTWTGEHKQPVWVTKWHPRELTYLMSASDDGTVRVWDLPSERSIWGGFGHSDYVRCGAWMAAFGGSGGLVVSGSYDRSIRVWDPRVGSGGGESGSGSGSKAVLHFQLKDPVEAVLPMPGGTSVLGAAGEKVAVLDLVAARPLHVLRNHQKTVTSLALAGQGTRVLSGALDGHVKIFDAESWSVVAGFKYPSPILAVDVVASGATREDRHLCVGMQSGLLSISTRLSGAAKAKAKAKEKEMDALISGKIEEHDQKLGKRKRGKGWEKRFRGKDYTGEDADIVIDGNERGKIRKNSPWEQALRAGRYGAALDMVLESGQKYDILTLITALVHRSALRTALKNRNASTLMPVLRWLNKYIRDPRFVRLTTDTAMVVLDLYGEEMGKSSQVDSAIQRLHENVRQGVEVAQTSWCTLGMLEALGAGRGTGV